MIKYATFLVAILGVTLAVYTAATARTEPQNVPPLAASPSINPFQAGIAATGSVEAASRNIPVSAPESGAVTRVLVQVGDRVKTGDALFELDARPLEADLLRAQAARAAAAARLDRARALPRAEEIPPLEAAVTAARAEVTDWLDQERRLREAGPGVAAERDLSRVINSLAAARARIAQAEANLALTRAGAWAPDIAIAQAELDAADADVRSIRLLIDRRTVRAPIDATVLKRNVEPGQYASAQAGAAAIVLGDLSTIHIRARIDEEDLPALRPGAKGVARVRGRAEVQIPLTMLRIEPLAEPKTQLSGSTTERVDTRVLEVLFRAEPPTTPDAPTLYPGQLVDVFIDGAPPPATRP